MREITIEANINGMCLWQVVLSSESGSWKGSHSKRKGCANQQGRVKSWGSQVVTELKFFMLKRGVTLEPTTKLIVASFSAEAVLMVETETMNCHSNVINRQHSIATWKNS